MIYKLAQRLPTLGMSAKKLNSCFKEIPATSYSYRQCIFNSFGCECGLEITSLSLFKKKLHRYFIIK